MVFSCSCASSAAVPHVVKPTPGSPTPSSQAAGASTTASPAAGTSSPAASQTASSKPSPAGELYPEGRPGSLSGSVHAPKPSPSTSPKPSASPSASAKPSASPSASAKPSATPIPSASAKPSPSPSPSANEKIPLPDASLAFFKTYFALQENNGFLLSNYSKPSEIDLQQLFYAGAGIASWNISPQEVEAYKAYYNIKELWGGLMKLTTKQINDYLKDKMGLTLADMKGTPMKWLYLKQFDAYYVERSDTNYGFFNCVSGYKTADGTVVVNCQVPPGYGQQVDKCEVTLKKVGDKFLFVSNKAHMTY